MDIQLRKGMPGDADSCGDICYRAFKTIADQHNFPPDFPGPELAAGILGSLLSLPFVYSVVAESGGRILGSNFLWEFEIAGIGPITVDPDVQNATVGRQLMNDVMNRAAEKAFAGVRLVQAAYHSRSLSLYTKLGFDAREPLSTMQGPAIKQAIPGYEVRPAKADDLAACNDLCRGVHGHERGMELQGAIAQGTARVVERGGRITGYATLIGFFGHSVGESNEDLEALIAAAPEFSGPGFLLPTRNAELFRWCLRQGIRVVQPMTLMTMGMYQEPRRPFLPSILY